VRNCEMSNLTTYKLRNENAKLNNICIETTAANHRSVQCEGKVSNQSVNADYVYS